MLIQRYQLGLVACNTACQPEEPNAKPFVPVKKMLIDWFKAALPDLEVHNLTTDWNDGIRLCALVNSIKPGLVPNQLPLDPNSALSNTSNAMKVAEEHFAIPQVNRRKIPIHVY